MIHGVIKNYTPEWAKHIARLWLERLLPDEINKLDIEKMGTETDGAPWVKLSNGFQFFGFPPVKSQKNMYAWMRKKIPQVEENCFSVIMDIVSRYKVPRSIPGESFYNPSPYMPLRDPLNDFKLPQKKKEELAHLFQPQPGETFVDVGAYLGYGTMRIAELVGSQGRVIAFESEPKILSIFRRNIEKNKIHNITIIPKAAAAFIGKGSFFRNEGTANSLNSEILTGRGFNELEKIEVETNTIDHALQNHSIEKVDKVNITINGGEVDALSGMQKTLANSEGVTLALAGWYKMPDGRKICDIVDPMLKKLGFTVIKGRLGRVLAWKESNS